MPSASNSLTLMAWTRLFGKRADDPRFKEAVAAAGVKKVPKLRKDRAFEQFDLGKLPYELAAGMTRREVRKAMGRPKRSTDQDDPPILDAWLVDGLQVIATYSSKEVLRMLGLQLPGA